ncbi:oligosaccharide flippase family protein [Bryocella elongata]|nr:oligosaccharide flippase family protein [Bryocella elongata]
MKEKLPEAREVANKAIFGILALGSRQVLVHGVNLAGNVMLARLLSPKDFGVYAVVIFLITFLGTFGGTGLASNLIRSVRPPTDDEYAAVFTAQQIVLCSVTGALTLLAPKLTQIYHLQRSYVWLFWLAAMALMITSLTVIPQIRMERELAFSRLAVAEVWQTIMFNVCAVVLAWRGFGGMSFGIALLVRALTSVIAIYLLEPWRPRWHWDWKIIRSNLSFGIYYQFSQVLSLVKDAIVPLLLGLVLGAASVGYTSWASMVASYPVLALMILQRVYLPTFSRLQHEPPALKRFVEKVVLATNALAAPASVFMLVLIYPLTAMVYGPKWYVAIPLYFLFWTTNLFSPTSTPLLALLNAMGFARIVFAFTVLWMVMTWVIGIPLVLRFGAIGLAWANVCVQVSNLFLFAIVKRKLPLLISASIVPGWALAAVVGLLLWWVNRVHPIQSIAMLLAYLSVGVLVYGSGMLYWHGPEIRQLLPLVRSRRVA